MGSQSGYFTTRMSFDKKRSDLWEALSGYFSQFIPADSTVLELGAGYCDFINNISAKKKYALDVDVQVKKYSQPNVTPIVSNCTKIPLPKSSVDVVFSSNLLEHLDDDELKQTLSGVHKVLKKNGIFIIMQPNFTYAYKQYFDDFTHKKIFTHVSLVDFLKANKFDIVKVAPKFLPFTTKSRLPSSALLLKIYLRLPIKPFAGQMLVVAKKSDN